MKADIAAWDGKATEPIAAVYARNQSHKTFLADVIALCGDAGCARGATWLLKHHIEGGDVPVPAALTRQIFAQLDALAHWEAKLHVLQCLPFLTIAKHDAQRVARFVDACRSDDATFVRAWAYTGLHQLAVQHPPYRDNARETLEAALKAGQPASVKVRIRRALAAGF
ncbi:MAG: hypothetical protein HQ495_10245 [Alphaproteobacteria bacterium]|nr:hypothetical protein [Alphaproteobacteria bacterium]